jgi:hypothetical protein
MKAIFGTIEFGYLCIGRDTSGVAIIHNVNKCMSVDDEDDADRQLSDLIESYIIPELNNREILFANAKAASDWADAITS